MHELVEQKWWEDPDMVGKPMTGVWLSGTVWVDVFKRYDKESDNPFKGDEYAHKNARPLTKEDLYWGEI